MAHATSELCSEAVKSNAPPSEEGGDPESDALAAIVNYTRRHEALMAYYYMENGQMKVRLHIFFRALFCTQKYPFY